MSLLIKSVIRHTSTHIPSFDYQKWHFVTSISVLVTPWGELPILKVDEKELTQSSAIYHYLGKQFGLIGKDDWEEALVLSMIQAQKDFSTKCHEFFAVTAGQKPGDKTAIIEQQFKPAVDKYITPMERQLKESGSGFFVASGVTYLDFFVAEYVDTLNAMFPQIFQRFPLLLEHTKRVHALPQLQAYLAKRPKTAA
uniref:glutathione transferase n=1 Tax=Panagrellus redivivus TaxID=6233 RepID=A0A7E4VI64_PANRE